MNKLLHTIYIGSASTTKSGSLEHVRTERVRVYSANNIQALTNNSQ